MSQEHRVLLSGTPLQNNVNELFSLLNFLEPTQFSSSEAFLREFGALKTETEVQKLQLILKPMMLRRLKEDVEKSIAPKEETVVEASSSTLWRDLHRFSISPKINLGNLFLTVYIYVIIYIV
jgi:chromodomain-helicase-DNA-binding protein 7